MKNILFIIYDLNGGGAEKVLLDLLENLNSHKYRIDLLLLRKQGENLDRLERLLVEKKINRLISLTGKRSFLNKLFIFKKLSSLSREIVMRIFKFFPKLWNLKLKNNYDIEIAFLEGITTEILALRETKAYKIAWVHIDLLATEKYKNIKKNYYKSFEKIICVSQDVRKSFINIYPELNKKTEVIYNLINKKKILYKAMENSNEQLKEKLRIISIGRLTYQKGYDILLKAHKLLLEEGLDYELIILGEGPERKRLEEYIKKTKISKNTKLYGFIKNPYIYLRNADIFVSSSRYEGYPVVLLEAISLSKPVIATSCAGNKEILENGKYGILVEKENIIELKERMKELIKNKILREKYESLSKECSKKFDKELVLKQIEKEFDKVKNN